MHLGPLVIDVAGFELTQEERQRLQHPLVGGLILFSRNFHSMPQLVELIQQIRALRQPELLIMVDHEGGRVQRFREGFTVLPPAGELGRLYQEDAETALDCAKHYGWLIAAELTSVGIDLNLGPVLDLNYSKSTVIGDRSFATQTEDVLSLAQAYQQGMNSAGMNAVGKHFPGHGGVLADSHTHLPVDPRDYMTLLQADMHPYLSLFEQGLSAVMTSHILYPEVDNEIVTYSSQWLEDILRTRCGFTGLVISDDLFMKAACKIANVSQRVEKALAAGCDLLLLCNQPEEVEQVLADFDANKYVATQRNNGQQLAAKRQFKDLNSVRNSPQWQKAHASIVTLTQQALSPIGEK